MYKIDSDIVFMCRTYTEIQVHRVFWCCCWSKLGLWAGRRLGWGGDIHEERWSSPRRRGFDFTISKEMNNEMQEMTPEAAANTKVICVGDKSRAFMARYFPKNLIMVGSEIGRLPPQV